ncbi:3'-5' exonuclease [Malaciobacter marinus]|jgi:DNA polymerase-3 subunit epsilon|uniref:DNA polymerase-3 subunit epsilon n=1 Tax=Malaciobacter marinus TaxID=505249 RepID=A0AB36ZS58_9BACT|nr:3'-5' exonuclease [Malaciobacter marinus]PPK58835.1 DNA polymerase-3 subunit epsilon [Malaciobacter marinus]SKB40057.1 DNA polymerase-3 subunit epsilon [Malaciobacter marinus]
MIILDFETNSKSVGDVIEVAAVKIDTSFNILDKFHRYYLSRYSLNPYSFAVHRLTPEMIMEYRKDKDYSSYFTEDEDFYEFCENSDTLIAHNISFELRHLNKKVYFQNQICTMKENKYIVNARNKNGNIKNPRLNETCHFYGIEFDENKHHTATYDVTKTFEILKCMHEYNKINF